MDVTFFATQAEWREWLEGHHSTATELWVGFHKKVTGRPSMTWPQSVDEALCFGWIDGVRKSLDGESYTIRFTPRKPGSTWSAVNVRRVGELTALGLMRPAGLKAFEERDAAKWRQYSYERAKVTLGGEFEAQLRANPAAWAFFEGQPPSYRKVATWWVMSAKREETQRKRLATLIAESEQGKRIAAVTYQAKRKDATIEGS
jgi:uncharacterized protein YdeI (YjbR/CyaY-like superfamily)